MWFAIATRQRSMRNKGKTMRVSGSLSGPCSGRGTGDQVASRPATHHDYIQEAWKAEQGQHRQRQHFGKIVCFSFQLPLITAFLPFNPNILSKRN